MGEPDAGGGRVVPKDIPARSLANGGDQFDGDGEAGEVLGDIAPHPPGRLERGAGVGGVGDEGAGRAGDEVEVRPPTTKTRADTGGA